MIYMSQCCHTDVNRDVADEGTFTYICDKYKKDCDVMMSSCGKEFVDEMDNDVTCGVEVDYWDEERKETLFATPICSECCKVNQKETGK